MAWYVIMDGRGECMELLAPAGSIEHLRIALDEGADAVYLGGKLFNARKSALNFDRDELIEAVSLCHLYGVAVYVTVNILIADMEMQKLQEYILDLKNIGVDAIIVQDIGVARLCKEIAPELELHASTQMTVTDLEGVLFLAKCGFSRVVLARELSIKEIEMITKSAPIEIEVFIHGAICVCYSGQCLMSSLIGRRSGNRGACAQSCRLPYELITAGGEVVNPPNEKYIMSPKDMVSDEYIDILKRIGVHSLKIEGRMKKPDYVKKVVTTYRDLIDGNITPDQANQKLQEGFNRGYTDGYWRNNISKEMLTRFAPNKHGKIIGKLRKVDSKLNHAFFELREKPEKGILKYIAVDGSMQYAAFSQPDAICVAKDTCRIRYISKPMKNTLLYWDEREGNKSISGHIKDLKNKIPVSFYLDIKIGQSIEGYITDGDNNRVKITHDFIPEEARTIATTYDMIWEQISRLGNTPFKLVSLVVSEGEYMIPKSILNKLRMDGVRALSEVRLDQYQRRIGKSSNFEIIKKPRSYLRTKMISVHARTLQEAMVSIKAGADEVIYGGESYDHHHYNTSEIQQVKTFCREQKVVLGMATARIHRSEESQKQFYFWRMVKEIRPDFVLLHSYGDYERWRNFGLDIPFVVDATLNVFNTKAVQMWEDLGAIRVMLSAELTLAQIKEIAKRVNVPLEIYACGRMEMMVTENCVINAYTNGESKRLCSGACCSNRFFLRDRLNKAFPLTTDQFCRLHILNSEVTDMLPHLQKLISAGITTFRIDAGGITLSELERTIYLYRSILNGDASHEKEVTYPSVTRGHLFRGIL